MSASKLVRPDTDYIESYLAALEEYRGEGRYTFQNPAIIKEDPGAFVKALRAEKGYPHQPYQDWVEPVPETIVWMVKDDEYIGTVDIRHRLNWHLEKYGGHVHFVVRPSWRGKGYGKKILKKAIPIVNYLGIDKALITLKPDDAAGIYIVESCGGIYEDTTPETECFPARARYWLDCR